MSFIVKLQSFAARMQTRGVGRVRVAGALVLILASIPSAPCRAENPENVLDHFLCYTLDPEPKFTPPTARIQVTDEIDKKTVKVQDRAFLCNPVTKTHGAKTFPQIHSNAHLVCYDVEPTSAGKDVLITNQFSTDPQYPRKLTLVTENLLCLPSTKDPEKPGDWRPLKLDHFECYTVEAPKEEPDSIVVSLSDQFVKSERDAMHRAVSRLCNPTDKVTGKGTFLRKNRDAHLVCHDIDISADDVKIKPVFINNQFERPNKRLTPLKPVFMCVPSQKYLL
jgi:hypothetical protein